MPRCFEAQIESIRILLQSETVGQKKVAREIRVVFSNRSRRNMAADFGEARIPVNGREVSAANGAIAIKQQTGTERSALVVQVDGRFEVANGFIDPIVLPQVKGGVEPRGGIIWIKRFASANSRSAPKRSPISLAALPRYDR